MSYILILTFSLFALGACGDKHTETPATEANITFGTAAVIFDYKAGSQTISVTADSDWGVSSPADWCTVSPSGGISGTSTLKITVAENQADTLRSTQLVFKSGSKYKRLDIKQNYKVEEVEIADSQFKSYLLANFDTDKDGLLSTVEAAAVAEMSPKGLGISSLGTLASFKSLKKLDCSNNALTAIDLSNVTRLTSLICSGNSLSELNIRLNQSLVELDCRNNPLTTIYVWNAFKAPAAFLIPAGAHYVEPDIDIPAGYKLVWQDEFNTTGHSMPDTGNWWYETGAGGWGNNELQNYVSGRQGQDTLAMVSDGTLKIIAKKIGSTVYSIRMNTNLGWTYGRFEARLKLPKGKGTWPAFWMMPKTFTSWPYDGEIDIMEEVGYNPNYVSASIHCMAYNHTIGTQKTAQKYVSGAQDDFHVYAVVWSDDSIEAYIDGIKYFIFPNDKTGDRNTWPFDAPFYLKLNLAWGGNWGGAQGVDESALPATYEVDYVRVFQKIE